MSRRARRHLGRASRRARGRRRQWPGSSAGKRSILRPQMLLAIRPSVVPRRSAPEVALPLAGPGLRPSQGRRECCSGRSCKMRDARSHPELDRHLQPMISHALLSQPPPLLWQCSVSQASAAGACAGAPGKVLRLRHSPPQHLKPRCAQIAQCDPSCLMLHPLPHRSHMSLRCAAAAPQLHDKPPLQRPLILQLALQLQGLRHVRR
mmetsp:Transcript_91761/g.168352  ORF Transcript_91761/g.168352 Transcript_91761/m.168352 type:complete len:206 (+) Transcript_91761:144-761(+)